MKNFTYPSLSRNDNCLFIEFIGIEMLNLI